VSDPHGQHQLQGQINSKRNWGNRFIQIAGVIGDVGEMHRSFVGSSTLGCVELRCLRMTQELRDRAIEPRQLEFRRRLWNPTSRKGREKWGPCFGFVGWATAGSSPGLTTASECQILVEEMMLVSGAKALFTIRNPDAALKRRSSTVAQASVVEFHRGVAQGLKRRD